MLKVLIVLYFFSESDHSSERLQEENTKFTEELDINKNGVLDAEELLSWASPNN